MKKYQNFPLAILLDTAYYIMIGYTAFFPFLPVKKRRKANSFKRRKYYYAGGTE